MESLAPVPIFPLPGLVALPGTEAGFHFFEPRYRAMARDVLASDSKQLVIANVIDGEGASDDAEGEPALHRVAGLAKVTAHEINEDGTVDVLFEVVARVRLHELPKEGLLYRRARCEVLEDVVRPGPTLDATAASLFACARELAVIEREVAGGRGVSLDAAPGIVANRLADRYFRGDSELRRQVLETLDVVARGELVLERIARLLATLRRAHGGMLS